MVVHFGYENLKLIRPVVTVGVFDGVHIGHRVLLKKLIAMAKKLGGESVVITFEPHPRIILSEKYEEYAFLSTLDEKKKLLAELGIEHLVVIKFDKELSRMEASEFIGKILVEKIGLKHLLVGHDNHIGRNKSGDLNRISESAEEYGFTVELVPEVMYDKSEISSTTIRNVLLEGRVQDAGRMLGYNYSLTGKVIEGRKLGRLLGFPTANINPADPGKLIPRNGVYAVEVIHDNKLLHGMLSVGYNPTVNKEKLKKSIEVHIFNFDIDIYGHSITIIFRYRLRDEKKFKSVRHLTDQMDIDMQKALRLLS